MNLDSNKKASIRIVQFCFNSKLSFQTHTQSNANLKSINKLKNFYFCGSDPNLWPPVQVQREKRSEEAEEKWDRIWHALLPPDSPPLIEFSAAVTPSSPPSFSVVLPHSTIPDIFTALADLRCSYRPRTSHQCSSSA